MGVTSKETIKLRDELLRQQTLYKQSLLKASEAMLNVESKLAEITDEDVETLLTVGIDIREVKSMNLDLARSDEEYLNSCAWKLDTVVTELYNYLREAMDVQNTL